MLNTKSVYEESTIVIIQRYKSLLICPSIGIRRKHSENENV
jgi:hypothetical protein